MYHLQIFSTSTSSINVGFGGGGVNTAFGDGMTVFFGCKYVVLLVGSSDLVSRVFICDLSISDE